MTLGTAQAEDRPRRRGRQSNSSFTRQVSQEALTDGKENESTKISSSSSTGRTSPVRCVSEFDKVAGMTLPPIQEQEHESSNLPSPISHSIPPFPNPLHNPKISASHSAALRLEADLLPMFLVLSRVMSHPTLNRKGLFNVPVDPVALNLPDYFTIITKPMDLGTVKARLHAIAYQSRQQVAEDIRLVFNNAMKYNPPHDAVHTFAGDLLAFFEDQLRSFVPDLAASTKPAPPSKTDNTKADAAQAEALQQNENPILRTVSTEPEIPSALAPSAPTAATSAMPTITCLPCAAPLSITAPVHSQAATRKNTPKECLSPSSEAAARKRVKRGAKKILGHNCQWCEGRTCSICHQGCLGLEPTLLICNGPQCSGAKIRKGAPYFIALDGSRQYCERCHIGLPAALPVSSHGDSCRYKRDLLKRKNDEEVVERWVSCKECNTAVHQVCAMYNKHAYAEDEYHCPDCVQPTTSHPPSMLPRQVSRLEPDDELYTFVSGSDLPAKMSEFAGTDSASDLLTAEAMPETEVSAFIQAKVQEQMVSADCPNAERTVVVRVISDCDRFFKVPEVVRKHFRMAAASDSQPEGSGSLVPPEEVSYRSKAISLFQKIDGIDVCIFCMYVQEHDGAYVCESASGPYQQEEKRVYIAYLDSVEHFRPRPRRTDVYHEILVAYLAIARKQGYETAHIWACPPSRGNSFVFWNHPSAQRTPSRDRLLAWYHSALSKAVERGVVTDVESLYDSCFKEYVEDQEASDEKNVPTGPMPCPPLLDGDFWIEEAVHLHGIHMLRQSKAKTVDGQILASPEGATDGGFGSCPALEVAGMLRDRVVADPVSLLFRRPVNAAALKLHDYHKIITSPMDLGTVHSRCIFGEYTTLEDLVADVELVVSNAKRYNPPGHFVHTKAEELSQLFFSALNDLTSTWVEGSKEEVSSEPWQAFRCMSMSLDAQLDKDHEDLVPSSDMQAVCDVVGCPQQEPVDVSAHGHPTSVAPSSSSLSSSSACTNKPGVKDLITGGPEAVQYRMVGDDTWLLDKKNPVVNKPPTLSKKLSGRRRKSAGSVASDESEPSAKRRRQSWLGAEVGTIIRRMRTDFFRCTLTPKAMPTQAESGKLDAFDRYSAEFDASRDVSVQKSSRIADARHSLLEVSQFLNLEFDTLRHAKYSTAVLLYYLHNDDAPGIVPRCSGCDEEIKSVRWHKISRVVERRTAGGGGKEGPPVGRKAAAPTLFQPEELCSVCHQHHANGDQFIPLQVSF